MDSKRCSFCRVPGHCKPNCEKHKVFLEMYRLLLLVPNHIHFADIAQVQRIFWKFYSNSISLIDLQNMSNDQFDNYISTNKTAFIQEVLQKYSRRFSANERRVHYVHQEPDLHEEPQGTKIGIELCVNRSKTVVECGICLSDNMPCSNMVKLGCNHEFCGDCVENMVNVNPCCAFCRADVKKVSVGSKLMHTKFKKNKKFAVC